MSFFTVGVNHEKCPVEIRERLHFTSKQLAEALNLSKSFSDLDEFFILSTCNRVELCGYTTASGIPEESLLEIIESTHEIKRETFLPYLYRHEGKDALRHLFRVASGLDSLVLGENEILGQIREAFRAANEAGTTQSFLYRLIEKALKTGKDVRTQTKINEGAISIPSVAVELAEKIFGRLSGEKIMILGTGEMAALALKNLKSAGADAVYVTSRNQERGMKLAQEFGAEWIPLESWEKYLPQVDILIGSTAAPHPIVHYEQVKNVMAGRKRRPLFLIDIAVPRDMEPEINSLEDVYLYNIDDLKGVSASNLKARSGEIRIAEDLVDRAVEDYSGWTASLQARPTIELLEKHLDEILAKEIPDERLRERIRAKLMHAPLEKIKEASQNGSVPKYLEALRSLFDLDENLHKNRHAR